MSDTIMAFTKKDAPNCDWCPYRTNCYYDLIGTKEAKKTWKDMRLAHTFRTGEVVMYEGEAPHALYVVCTGKVKVYKSSRTGQQLTTRIEYPGDLVGHIAMLAEGTYTSNVEALEQSVVSMIDKRTFLNFLTRFPNSALALLKVLSIDVRRGENKARDIAFKPARGRLADTLIGMMQPRKPYPIISGIKRRDLGEMSGLTIETTVRLLKDFESRDLIRREEKDILILNPDALKSLSGAAA
ncbi:MAG: Crp/Fnr family transcriptional regulator [Elusimicrobia bacterium]|nr:Crp/Fnr family transcriptional regulator [Elusimicrobiota bacterium]